MDERDFDGRTVAGVGAALVVAAGVLISLGVAIYPYAGDAYARLVEAVPSVRLEIDG